MVSGRKLTLGLSAAVTASLLALTGCTSSHNAGGGPAQPTARPSGTAAPSSHPAPSKSAPGSKASATKHRRNPATEPHTSVPPVSTPSITLGAEGQILGAGPTCQIASPQAVASAFGGHVGTTKVTTSALGNPMCVFTLKTSNVGAAGTVTMSLDAKASSKSFSQAKKQSKGAVAVPKLGNDAFYVNDTSTMHLRSGDTSVVVQATMKLKAGTKYAKHIQADVLTLSKVIVAQI